MKSKKERFLIIGAIVLLLCTLSTTAFITDGVTTNNVLTFGRLRLELINHTLNENGEEVSVEQTEEKLTGNNVSRMIKVKNICENPMYVRVKIDFKGEDKQGTFPAGEYASFENPNGTWSQKNEWFYYEIPLEPGKETDNLLTELNFDLDRLMTDHPGSSIDFVVSAQAVQTVHNGDTAMEAKGWPQEAGK